MAIYAAWDGYDWRRIELDKPKLAKAGTVILEWRLVEWDESSVEGLGRRFYSPHVQVDEDTEYGYLWWLRRFGSRGSKWSAFLMQGNGGNKVAVFPGLDLVTVVTSTNYNTTGMHDQMDRLVSDYVLDSVLHER